MINNNRIVPVQKIDLLTLFGTILSIHGTSYNVLESADVEGSFTVEATGAAGNLLANQPVKTLDFGSGVTSGTVYFVAANDYAGITVDGAAATIAEGSAEVKTDSATLYTAALSSGEVTITAVSPVAE